MNNSNMIILNFPSDLTCLAGYEYGNQIYQEQIKDKLDLEQPFCVRFPYKITAVSCSFIDGLFAHIIRKIGLTNTKKRLRIRADNNNGKLEKTILTKLGVI